MCAAGLTECDGACVDTAISAAHCGGCDQPSTGTCEGGDCILACELDAAVVQNLGFVGPDCADCTQDNCCEVGNACWNDDDCYDLVFCVAVSNAPCIEEGFTYDSAGLACLAEECGSYPDSVLIKFFTAKECSDDACPTACEGLFGG